MSDESKSDKECSQLSEFLAGFSLQYYGNLPGGSRFLCLRHHNLFIDSSDTPSV